MIEEMIFGLIGGLGMFIFGIEMMSKGLQKAAGNKIRSIITYLTNNRFKGVLFGTIMTSILQSSSAATVMVVGFANAGLITLLQAVPVILGANIGTTVTGQLIAFKLTHYALPIVAIGSFLYLFSKKKLHKDLGEAVLGFGLLFLGLSIMSGSVESLSQGENIYNILSIFGRNPILGILAGMIATAILQSSSVVIGIVIVISGMGMISLPGAVALVFGTNIGTCVTAMLSSIKGTLNAKRTAIAHLMFNVIGTILGLILLPLYVKGVMMIPGTIERQVANANTFYNIFNAILFIGFVPAFVAFVKKIVPGTEQTSIDTPKYLDKHLLETPDMAMKAAKKEIVRMMEIAKDMMNTAYTALHTGNKKDIEKVLSKEVPMRQLRGAISDYMILITGKDISDKDAQLIPAYLDPISDIERIVRHSLKMARAAQRMDDNKLKIPAIKDLDKIHSTVDRMLGYSLKALPDLDGKIAHKVAHEEAELNKDFHIFMKKKIKKTMGSALQDIIYVETLTNLEKIGDHAASIGRAIERNSDLIENSKVSKTSA